MEPGCDTRRWSKGWKMRRLELMMTTQAPDRGMGGLEDPTAQFLCVSVLDMSTVGRVKRLLVLVRRY